jgi:predicted phage tail protein
MRIECKSIYKVKGSFQMTQVTLHGILAKEFRKTFSLAIQRPKEVFDAISCAHSNFRNRLFELSNQGIHFSLLIDGKKITHVEELSIASEDKQIDIVPIIGGSGAVAIGVIGAGLASVGGAIGTSAFLVGLAGTAGAAAIGSAITYLGVGLMLMAVQMALAPKPEMQRPSSDVNSAKQSFLFSSKANVAEQGIPVPVGYGRLRVGSAVIQSTIKSYPQAFEKENSLFSDGQALNNDRTS